MNRPAVDDAAKRIVLVTRPRPQAVATARLLHHAGHRALIDPLLHIQTVPFTALDPTGAAAILLTSANAALAFEPRLASLPVLAVGRATAAIARRKGWLDVRSADGDARALVRLVAATFPPEAGALLHPAGEETREHLGEELLALGYDYRRLTVYRAEPAQALNARTQKALRDGLDAVLLFSPRTAAVFGHLVEVANLVSCLKAAQALCLSEDVANRVRELPWRGVRVAPRRTQEALVACLETESATC